MKELSIANASPDLSFPWRLYIMLRDAETEFPSVICWLPHPYNGHVFQVHDPNELEKRILSKYFNSSIKYSSFRRQLIGYGFQALGKMQYAHKEFSRDDPQSCDRVVRVKKQRGGEVGGTKTIPEPQPGIIGSKGTGPISPQTVLTDGKSLYSDTSYQPVESLTLWQSTFQSNEKEQLEMEEILDDLEPFPLFLSPTKTLHSGPPHHRKLSHQQQQRAHETQTPLWLSPLERVWMNLKLNTKDLEPRPIQDMISIPNPWYKYTPFVTPEQHAVIEIAMPVSLPGSFYYLDMPVAAHVCGFLMVILHTTECLYTNFGGGAWYKDAIGPVQHIAGDMLLNHSLNSLFLLLGPSYFGPYCYILALIIIPANSTMAAFSFKIHFDTVILKPFRTEETPRLCTVAGIQLQHKMGRHIRRMLLWYLFTLGLLATSTYFGNSMTQVLAVFVYNLLPFAANLSYSLAFSKQLRLLPKKQRTVLCDWHLNFMRHSDSSKNSSSQDRQKEA